ncbi:MAG: adenine deaminase C-terminal domain-containing protein [Armatimonadota bacterium]|nr:adenine deaminase C-terminal domain-containing protein [Armatimonadota bacterium]MDR7452100.1 adenine deaminase C-terminal domain-containing protein [Armatimonadota bacterium]MDR7467824.1 adenine deaminase C-terminal domain-containing protein [Armatimonadota bacterium]MDR7494712.1 adenine deaminase C-terminal domain-containing protein [Armatimonadota bacterium]MDR7499537.1 adenine deaminase C-terminal domain-containing protein [Armatimonadota bacterium]
MPSYTDEDRRRAVEVARGRAPADLLITNIRLVNTFTAEIYPAQVATAGALIAAVLGPDAKVPAREVVDGGGAYAVPGFVDSHLHIESSMVLPQAFAEAVVPRGVLTVIADPHEIANVMGLSGIRLMLEAARDLPLDVYFQAPSCVPATALETAGAEIGPREINELLSWPEVLALGEVMDFNAVVSQDGRAAAVLAEAVRRGAVIEGHAPNLTGGDLAAYVAAGVTSDHTFVTPALAAERLRGGVTLQLQLKSLAPETLRQVAVLARSLNLCLVTDDVMPDDLVTTGHLDHIFRTAVSMGLDPVEAVRAATLAPARRMRLFDRGAIAPGLLAHLVLTRDLRDFRPELVFHAGRLVARQGELVTPLPDYRPPQDALATVRIDAPGVERFRIRAPGRASDTATVRVIAMRPDSTYTAAETARLPVRGDVLDWTSGYLCLAAVFERHGRAGTSGYGFVRGALRRGAVAMTWAHDSHNLLVVGRTPEEMALAARWVVAQGGGMAAVQGTEVLGGVRLPVAGIVSDRPVREVARDLAGFRRALGTLGFEHRSPVMALGVLTLPVSPALKLTDRGLVDVAAGKIVPLFVEQ